MSKTWLFMAACVLAAGATASGSAQGGDKSSKTCNCGAHPPGPPRDRSVAPYAGEPS